MALQNIEANITLDLYNHDTTPSTVKAIQLDSQTRYVAARLQNMGAQYDVDSGATVQLTVIRPDKVGVQISGTTFTYGDEGAQFLGPYAELTLVALAVSGKLLGQFKITSGTQILRTEIFMISAGVALDASTDEWAGDYDGYNLDELVEKVDAAVDKVESMEDDVSELKSGFNNLYNTAYVTDSASGSVAHFVDGADNVPMKSIKVNIAPAQSGSGDPSPDNVRPISGFNSVKVTRAGKNLLVYPYSTVDSTTRDGITFEVHKTVDGRVDYVSASGTATGASYFNFNAWGDKRTNAKSLVGKTLKLTGCPKLGNDNKVSLMFQCRKFGSQKNIGLANDFGEGSKEFSVPSDMESWAIYIQIAEGTQVSDARFYPMLRLASDIDDTYEHYNGKDYNISLSSAETVYGGTLDAVSGELTVDRKSVLVDGTQDIRESQVQRFFISIADAREITIENQGTDASVISERFKSYTWSRLAQETGCAPVYGFGVAFRNPAITTVSAWKEFFQNNPTRFVYMLATPITYNLTPTEVKSLLGINNVWSDAGDVDVEYRADTKLYIKRLTGSDTDMVADANIASGAQIVVGTNATKVSLSEALNQIKEA